jgi:hypothetical protein
MYNSYSFLQYTFCPFLGYRNLSNNDFIALERFSRACPDDTRQYYSDGWPEVDRNRDRDIM